MWKEVGRVVREMRWVKEIRVLLVQEKHVHYLLCKGEVDGACVNVGFWWG